MSLLGKSPLPNKTLKYNGFFTVRRGHADNLSMFKNHFTLLRYNFYFAFIFWNISFYSMTEL